MKKIFAIPGLFLFTSHFVYSNILFYALNKKKKLYEVYSYNPLYYVYDRCFAMVEKKGSV